MAGEQGKNKGKDGKFVPVSTPVEQRASAPVPMSPQDAASMLPRRDWAYGDPAAPETPWGLADSEQDLGGGVLSYGTPGHGGIMVPAELQELIPVELRDTDRYFEYDVERDGVWTSKRVATTAGWYEEDCDWAVAVYFLHDRLSAPAQVAFPKDEALATIGRWRADEFAAWEARS